MLFNSLPFLLFFPLTVAIYWGLRQTQLRNHFLLIASYYFYMNWEPVYALLILISSVTTWGCGILMERAQNRKKLYLILCISVNLLILGVYKYAGFISTMVHDALEVIGIAVQMPQFELLLPVGISFYTFQALGYTIDVYKGKIKAERHLSTYALFVSFFPQLVAGPIERASNLLPQFHNHHRFSAYSMITGLQMMLWGYFMKLCIAENVATYVNAVYNNLPYHNGTSILLASFFFTFQIFCDFAGYSLIAIGAARAMGFTLMDNFKRPYLATSIRHFWRRWHISLTSWFTEYVYIPLGGNRCSKLKHTRNTLVTFLCSGIWHGANYTFIVWGCYHGVLMVIQNLSKPITNKVNLPNWMKTLMRPISILCTFVLVSVGWIFFRSNTLQDSFEAFRKILFERGPLYNGDGKPAIVLPLLLIGVLMCKEMIDERKDSAPATSINTSMTRGWMMRSITSSAVLLVVILLCASFEGGQFIYFQF